MMRGKPHLGFLLTIFAAVSHSLPNSPVKISRPTSAENWRFLQVDHRRPHREQVWLGWADAAGDHECKMSWDEFCRLYPEDQP